MATARADTDAAISAAAFTACGMIAHQVGGKAARDAIFLSNFEVTDLPKMLIAAAIISVAIVLGTAKAMSRFGPGRLVPAAFAVSALVQVGEWALIPIAPRIAAVALYLHIAVFGSVLISGFWSMVNERFDPRTAKKRLGKVAGAGTLGGLIGGVLAERTAAWAGASTMLLLLAALHLFCAWRVLALRTPKAATKTDEAIAKQKTAPSESQPKRSGLQVLAMEPYLRALGGLVLLGTVAAALIDYVFKAQAAAVYTDGDALMRFFAWFYTGASLLTFGAQMLLSKRVLERLGIARSVGLLPWVVVAGGTAVAAAPGLVSATLAYGLESITRSSLYRMAYELLFTPVKPEDKRATKTIIDVGFDRLGDALGGGIVQVAIWVLAPAIATRSLVVAAAGLGIAGVFLCARLHRGYVDSLEQSLLHRAGELDIRHMSSDGLQSAMMLTLGDLDLRALTRSSMQDVPSLRLRREAAGAVTPPRAPTPTSTAALEPIIEQTIALRSGDPEQIRRVLSQPRSISTALVPHVIPLLAWDEVSPAAQQALRRVADRILGQLIDALLDPTEEFAVRRRLPRVVVEVCTDRGFDGLMRGLEDKRFEVRFNCGRALARMTRGEVPFEIKPRRVYAAVLREVAVDRRVWESQRLLDTLEHDDEASVVDDMLRQRTTRSMEHVFTLLSIVLPRQALKVSFSGLYTDDDRLRGTALEYLESVLPGAVRRSLWPFLEDHRPTGSKSEAKPGDKPRAEILEDLLKSHESIQLNLDELRRHYSSGSRKPDG